MKKKIINTLKLNQVLLNTTMINHIIREEEEEEEEKNQILFITSILFETNKNKKYKFI